MNVVGLYYTVATLAPCDELWERAKQCKFAIVEMSVPDRVITEYHHTPSQISQLANECPDTVFLLTHTYIDCDYEILTTDTPELPPNVILGHDGMKFSLDQNGESV